MIVYVVMIRRNGSPRALMMDDEFRLLEEADANSDLVRHAVRGLAPQQADPARLNGALSGLTPEESREAIFYRVIFT